ncbi:MAG: transcription antitermination factor NusB [Corynebacteriales bacterium]|nr:transcription antitermination factor NusB [Mycobacteriales bacterium]
MAHETGRSARRKARKHALDVLFEADVRGVDIQKIADSRGPLAQRELPEYARVLVRGVQDNLPAIDELISTYAEGWELKRLPAVDRNILRIGIFELNYVDDVPDGVAVDEAVSLAKELSTDDSPKFINGLLGRLQLLRP